LQREGRYIVEIARMGRELANREIGGGEGRSARVPPDPNRPIDTAWDLGMGDSTVVWAYQITDGGIDCVACYENHGEEASHYVAELNSRGWYGGRDIVPHDIKVREWGTGRTRFETICRLAADPSYARPTRSRMASTPPG
jgi:phage terminase large subunit